MLIKVREKLFTHQAIRMTAARHAPLLLFLFTFALYSGPYLLMPNRQVPFSYFDFLADAFLHGRLYLLDPVETWDLTLHNGHWYVPFPPLPALLMLPIVALGGIHQRGTMLFSALFGALNTLIIFQIIQALVDKGWVYIQRKHSLYLAALFAFGTVHWWIAMEGSVWFVAQTVTVTFSALAVWTVLRGASPWWVGSMLALAVGTRPTVIFLWVFLVGIFGQEIQHKREPFAWKKIAVWACKALVPSCIAVTLLLAYNVARFGHPLDFGYLNQRVDPKLVFDLQHYGQFNLIYVPRNLYAMLLALPSWNAACARLVPDPNGMSMLLTTSPLIFLFRPVTQKLVLLTSSAWAAILLLLMPLLTYYNTGYYQFGYRFSLDFIVPIMVLMALSMRGPWSWPAYTLIATSILVNIYGIVWRFGYLCT